MAPTCDVAGNAPSSHGRMWQLRQAGINFCQRVRRRERAKEALRHRAELSVANRNALIDRAVHGDAARAAARRRAACAGRAQHRERGERANGQNPFHDCLSASSESPILARGPEALQFRGRSDISRHAETSNADVR
ncbi:hypothetical protein PT2222_40159 [Paraburkholderia tropica]